MQTSKEAVSALFQGKMPDYVPLHDYLWDDTLDKWVAQGMPEDGEGGAVDPVDHFGFDLVSCGGWFPWTARVPDRDEIVEETDEWKIVRNGNGAALKWWKHKSGTPEHIDFHMSSRDIWEKTYRPRLIEPSVAARITDPGSAATNLKTRKDKWTFFGHLFVWEFLRESLGDVNMYMALAQNPEWIHDFNRVYTDLYKACYAYLFEKAGLPDGIWIYEDLGYRGRLICSPGMLEDLFFPYYREIVDFFHGYGLPVVLHSCGFQEPMIPLAVQAGFDALNPMEVKAGNDVLSYAEKFGAKLCFIGGFDARVLESGDRELIRKSITSFMTGMKERDARFVYASDHSISTLVNYEDFLFSLEVYRDNR